MATADELLGAKLSGTARRGVRSGEPDVVVIEYLRAIAAGNTAVLQREAARAIGGWLGLPAEHDDLRAAYLLIKAADVPLREAGPFLAEVDAARNRTNRQHGTGEGHGDRPPT